MTKVIMLKTATGVNDGDVYPKMFEEGKAYTVGENLLACFIQEGVVSLEHETQESGEKLETKVVEPQEKKRKK